MKKLVCRKLYWLAAAACLLSLSGCASAGAAGREPEDTVLAQVIGVDVDGRGVSVTAAGEDGEETVLVSASGDTLEAAFAALPSAGEKYFSLTNVNQILVGDGTDIISLLNYVLEDPDMSYMAKVWGTGFAGGLMEDMKETGLGRLRVLERGGAETVTVKTALAELLSGRPAEVPVLILREKGLEVAGKLYFEVSASE